MKPLSFFLTFLIVIFFITCSKPGDVEPTPPVPPSPPGPSSAPVILSFSPMNAHAGDTVTISGNNFTGASVVMFGTTNAQTFSVISDTKILAKVGAGSSGNITVTSPVASVSLAGFVFLTVNATPQLLLEFWYSDPTVAPPCTTTFYYDNVTKRPIRIKAGIDEILLNYNSDTISYVTYVESYQNPRQTSMVFTFDTHKRCNKIYFKKPVSGYSPSAPYFSDTTDGAFARIDSLVYSSTGQLTEIWDRHVNSGNQYVDLVKFIYNSLQSETPDVLQHWYLIPAPFLESELTFTADSTLNPVYRAGWIIPFATLLLHTTNTPNAFGSTFFTPEVNFADNLRNYLCMIKRLPRKYKYQLFGGSSPYTFTSMNYITLQVEPPYLLSTRLPYTGVYDPSLPYVNYRFAYF